MEIIKDILKNIRKSSTFNNIDNENIYKDIIIHLDSSFEFIFNEEFSRLVLEAIEKNDISNFTSEKQEFIKQYMKEANEGKFTTEILKQFDKFLGELE